MCFVCAAQAIGGSNTVGHGAGDGMNWPQYLKNWLNDAFPTQASAAWGWAELRGCPLQQGVLLEAPQFKRAPCCCRPSSKGKGLVSCVVQPIRDGSQIKVASDVA